MVFMCRICLRDEGVKNATQLTCGWVGGFLQEQMTKPYYSTLWKKVKPLWIEPGECLGRF
jgi:hypothetical protein